METVRMDLAQRIAQFENMAQADPSNEMAHYSLGGAYSQAGRFPEAAESFLRCTEVSPQMSKAYQLAGKALMQAGDSTRAVEVLSRGYQTASLNGDLMPKRAIEAALRSLGAPVPEIKGASETADRLAASGSFICAKTGRPGAQLPKPPFRGPVGRWIYENISAETFNAWIPQGTKVINELRLDLSREEDSETYDRYMREYLGIDEDLHAKLRTGAR